MGRRVSSAKTEDPNAEANDWACSASPPASPAGTTDDRCKIQLLLNSECGSIPPVTPAYTFPFLSPCGTGMSMSQHAKLSRSAKDLHVAAKDPDENIFGYFSPAASQSTQKTCKKNGILRLNGIAMSPAAEAFFSNFSPAEMKRLEEKQTEQNKTEQNKSDFDAFDEEDEVKIKSLGKQALGHAVVKDAVVDDTYEETYEEKQAKGGKRKKGKEVEEDFDKVHNEVLKDEDYEPKSKRCRTNARARQQQKGRGTDGLLNGRQDYLKNLRTSVINRNYGKRVTDASMLHHTPDVRMLMAHRADKTGIPTWQELVQLIPDTGEQKEKTYKEQIIAYMQKTFGDAASSESGAAFMGMYSKILVKRDQIRPNSKQQKRKREGYEKNQEIVDDVKAKQLVLNENLFPARMWGPLRINKLRLICELIEYCEKKGLFGVKIAREKGKTEPVSGWSQLEFEEPLAFVFWTVWREGPSKQGSRKKFPTVVLKTMRDELMMRMWMVEESVDIEGCWKKIHMRAKFNFREDSVWTAIFGAGLYKKDNIEVSKITIMQQGKDTPLAVCEFKKKDGNKRELVVRESESDMQTHAKENIVGSAAAARVRKKSPAKDDSADSDE